MHNGMNSTKTVIASQANRIHHYKNVRRKILKCCADIYFNQQCVKQNLIPNYAKVKIKISNTNQPQNLLYYINNK